MLSTAADARARYVHYAEELVAMYHSNKPQLTVLVDGSVKVGTGLSAHVEYQLSFRTTLPGLPLTGAAGSLAFTHTHTHTQYLRLT